MIADEINNAIDLNLISEDDALALARLGQEKKIDLIFTGRAARQKIIDAADLVSNIMDVKHPFYEGKKARRGIEY